LGIKNKYRARANKGHQSHLSLRIPAGRAAFGLPRQFCHAQTRTTSTSPPTHAMKTGHHAENRNKHVLTRHSATVLGSIVRGLVASTQANGSIQTTACWAHRQHPVLVCVCVPCHSTRPPRAGRIVTSAEHCHRGSGRQQLHRGPDALPPVHRIHLRRRRFRGLLASPCCPQRCALHPCSSMMSSSRQKCHQSCGK
jgi:hypothetical protein